MKVIAFAASNSKNSINKQLVTYAANVLKSKIVPQSEIEILDLNDFEAPLFSVDIEAESGIPEAAKSFFTKLGSADIVLVSYAEHNGSYTAAWKSLFDWMSRIDRNVFQDKPMVVFSTSPGPGGAANVLAAAVGSAQYFGADIKGNLSIPSFNDNFDVATNRLTSEELNSQLIEAFRSLA
ncbi:MAG: NADPH-dependent FMN reductase [Mariniblastus sp.]